MADDILRHVYDWYVNNGLAPHQAAAMAAHAMAESGGNPTIQEAGGKGPGYGLFQWTTPSRRQGLDQFAKDQGLDPNALNTQLAYSLKELNTTEAEAGRKLKGAKTYREAVDAGMDYLRPAGYTPDNPAGGHNYAGRWNYGAVLAGEQPMVGGAVAAAGGQAAPAAPAVAPLTPKPDTGLLAAAQAAAAKTQREKEESAAAAELTKTGMGLLSKAETPPLPFLPPAPVHRPEPQQQAAAAAGLPGLPDDFQQLLMRQRLMRRT